MAFKFPFTNYHELNLDWILKKVETLSVNAEADANTIATYEQRLQTAETQAQNAETSAANAQTAATAAASVAETALNTANSAQSSADASGALASQAAVKADAAQSTAENAQQAAEAAQATAANFDARITSAESQATQALNMAQGFDEQARAAITTANNAALVAGEAQALANTTALELARQRTALETIGSQQTASINSAGAAQVTAINNAGQAVLNSIPPDYMNGVELVKDYTLGLYPQIETDYAPIVSLDNGADNIPVKDLNVNIIPNQSGTGDPSPSNIRPISARTGAEIYRTGINVWDEEWEVGNINWSTGQNDASSTRIRSKNYIPVVPGSRYYLLISTRIDAFYYNSSYEKIQAINFSTSQIITIPENITFMRFSVYTDYGIRYNNNISINYPATETAYHAFSGSQISVTFPQEAGAVYGGILNTDENGSIILQKDWEFLELTGNEDWSVNEINPYYILNLAGVGNNFVVNDVAVCSHFLDNPAISSNNTYPGFRVYYSSAALYSRIIIRPPASLNITTLEEFKQWLADQVTAGTPVQLAYKKSFSTNYEVVSNAISTLYGHNNVWSNAGNTALTYRADLGLYITENSIANYTKFAGMIAGVETGLTASQNYSAGDYFILGQKLYKALTTIATGATFTLGTNCEETTVGAELILAQ